MDRYSAMKIFVKVAETGNFAEAARLLYTSAPAVTRAIAYLEDMVNARLFVRTTRAVKITEPGKRYLRDCRRILADIEASEAAAGEAQSTPAGILTVTAPALFGKTFVLPVLLDYLKQYPRVTGRTVFVNRVTNLVDEGIDVAVRVGRLPDSGYRAIRVGSVRSVMFGAPSYFERAGIPNDPSDLEKHSLVASTTGWFSQEWTFGSGPIRTLTVHPRLLCDSDDAAIAAVLAGWGLSRLLVYKIAQALIDGRLQSVLSDFEEPPEPVHVLHPEGRYTSAKVRAFLDLLVDQLRANKILN
jgi:DNA-binding transcriptional LysR family regulator